MKRKTVPVPAKLRDLDFDVRCDFAVVLQQLGRRGRVVEQHVDRCIRAADFSMRCRGCRVTLLGCTEHLRHLAVLNGVACPHCDRSGLFRMVFEVTGL